MMQKAPKKFKKEDGGISWVGGAIALTSQTEKYIIHMIFTGKSCLYKFCLEN